MRPHQRTRGAGRLAEKEFALGNISAVPDLLRQKAAAVGRKFHYPQKFLRTASVAGRQFVMRALSGQQRPGTPDSCAVERAAVGVFAVAVVVVTVPARPLRKLDPEPCVNEFYGVEHSRIIDGAQSESHQRQRVWADNVRRSLI